MERQEEGLEEAAGSETVTFYDVQEETSEALLAKERLEEAAGAVILYDVQEETSGELCGVVSTSLSFFVFLRGGGVGLYEYSRFVDCFGP